MAVVVVFVLMDTQLFPHLPDIGRVDFEAVFFLHILLDVIVGVDLTNVGLQISRIDSNMQIVADLLSFCIK